MKKKLLIVTSLIILLVAVVGFWGYNKYFKVDPKIQKQLYNQFGADFFTSFVDTKGVSNSGTEPKIDNSKTVTVTGKPEEGKSLTATPDGEKSPDQVQYVPEKPVGESQTTPAAPTSVNAGIPANQITEADVVRQYMPEISSLQNIALSRLNTLYSMAVQEYKQRKKAGTLNRAELARKYIQAGNLLEANVDSQFSGILNAMQSELVANNLPTDEVGVIKNEYEQAKSVRRSQLLAKALK